jgi:hypothetical protein
MSALSDWKVHGPVHTLRTEHAEWDLTNEEWLAPRGFSVVHFLRNGSIAEAEHHNPDGSICRMIYSYDDAGRLAEIESRSDGGQPTKFLHFRDDAGRLLRSVCVDQDGTERESEAYSYAADGRKTKVHFIPHAGGGVAVTIEGTDHGYSTNGATTMTTAYNEREQPEEVFLKDANGRVVGRVTFERDEAGRVLKEEMHSGEQGLIGEIASAAESGPPGSREGLAAILSEIFGPTDVTSSTTYAYDEKGRVAERQMRMGSLGGHRTTYRYDGHDNPVEETTVDSSREMGIDDEGKVVEVRQNSSTHHLRFEYAYDALGNWTERVVWSRLDPNPDFQRSNVERRLITYYEG